MLLWGACAYLAWLVPSNLEIEVGRRLAALRTAAIAAVLLSTLAALPVEAARIGDGWPDAVNAAMLDPVLFDTTVGRAWLCKLGAACLLTATLAAPARLRLHATATAAGLCLAALALTGHAAMQEGWVGVWHRTNDVTHLLAGGAWLGALVPFLVFLRQTGGTGRSAQLGLALRRFSLAGHVAVALVIATGLVNNALTLGRWPTDWSSLYQTMLAGKILLVLAMVLLALTNRYRLVPRLRASPVQSLTALRQLTKIEVAFGVAVVALVSAFGLLEPT